MVHVLFFFKQTFILSQFQRPEVWNQHEVRGQIRVSPWSSSSRKLWGRIHPYVVSFWCQLAVFGLWLHSLSLQSQHLWTFVWPIFASPSLRVSHFPLPASPNVPCDCTWGPQTCRWNHPYIIYLWCINSNNLRYADDTILMAESEEELKSLLMKVEEESKKAGLKLIIEKTRSWHPVPSLLGK